MIEDLAKKHELAFDARGPEPRATGTYRGTRVVLTRERVGRRVEYLFEAYADPGTDLLLASTQAGFFTADGNCPLDDSAFTGIYSTSCAPAELANARRAMSPGVRSALLALANLGRGSLDDHAARVRSAFLVPFREGAAVLDACVDAALALRAAAADCTPPAPLRERGLDRVAEQLAARHGVTLHPHPLRLEGPLGDAALSLRFFAYGSRGGLAKPGYALALRFAVPLALGVALRPARALDRALRPLRRAALTLGDAASDRAFYLTAQAPDAAREHLRAARAPLLALARAGLAVELDDAGLRARAPLPDAEQLARVLDALAELRPALVAAPLLRGGYR